MNDEDVLVVAADELFSEGEWFGLTTKLAGFRSLIADPRALEYRPRSQVESDPSFKQLIPYAVLKRGKELFSYRRGKAGGENRLHDLWSIGVGGHICREDGDAGEAAYETGFRRELDEEVSIQGEFKHRIVGLLYDPSTPVGSVHVGVVHLVDVSGEVAAADPSLADGRFRSIGELLERRNQLETWSQFVIEPLRRGEL